MKKLTIKNVYLHVSEVERAEVVDFWNKYGAIPNQQVALNRTRELVFIAREESGEIVGVNTVGFVTYGLEKKLYYYYRIFIAPDSRGSRLTFDLSRKTRFFLKTFQHPLSSPEGVLVVTENAKFMKPGLRRYFEKEGYLYQGRTQHGCDMWIWPFGVESHGRSGAEQ